MTDDPRKRRHRDYAGRATTPATGTLIRPPIAGVATGELDSDDARMAEHFEDDTPVEVLKRIERKLNPQPDAKVIVAEVDRDMPEWVRHLEERCGRAEAQAADAAAKAKVCDDERLKRERWKHWLFGGKLVGASGIFTLLAWIGTSLEARAASAVEARQRVEMLQRHDVLLDKLDRLNIADAITRFDRGLLDLQFWRAGVDATRDARRNRDRNSDRGDSP